MKKLSIDEIIICSYIAKRAIDLEVYTEEEKLIALIDITAGAATYEVDLEDWLNACDEEFISDMVNIKKNINREASVSFNKGVKLKFATVK